MLLEAVVSPTWAAGGQVDYLCRWQRKESVTGCRGWTALLSLKMLFLRSKEDCQIPVGKFGNIYDVGRQFWRPFHLIHFTSIKLIMKGLSSLVIIPFTADSFPEEVPGKGCSWGCLAWVMHRDWSYPVGNVTFKKLLWHQALLSSMATSELDRAGAPLRNKS